MAQAFGQCLGLLSAFVVDMHVGHPACQSLAFHHIVDGVPDQK
jgi:hypothetical protein